MVQRSVEFVSSPPRNSIVVLPPHMDKSKSQPQHSISAEPTLDREKPTFSSLWLGGRQEYSSANHYQLRFNIAHK